MRFLPPVAAGAAAPAVRLGTPPVTARRLVVRPAVVAAAAGILAAPAGILTAPARMLAAPAGMLAAPAGMLATPAGMLAAPTGMLGARAEVTGVISAEAMVLARHGGVVPGVDAPPPPR